MEADKISKERYFCGLRVSAIVEVSVFFFALSLGAILFGVDLNFDLVCPHPYWIIILLVSSQYGTVEGLFAATVATVIFVLGPQPERNLLQEKAEYFFQIAKTPILWFVSAVFWESFA